MRKMAASLFMAHALALYFLSALLLAGTALGEVSREGLVGEWHFDGDANDSSGNGNDGTVYGASFVDGKFGKALSFDGVDDKVRIPRSSSLDITGSEHNGLTIEFWGFFNRDSGGYAVFKKYAYGFKDMGSYTVLYTNSGGRIYAEKFDYNIPENQWLYISTIWNKTSGKKSLYVNGILLSTVYSHTSNIDLSSSDIYIGYSQDWHANQLNGLIDEVSIYNRALSADEIKAHYEGKQTASTALTLTKTASPYSIKQGQTTTVTLTIKNTGTTDITNIEVMDSIHRNFDLISGDFPNPRKFDIIGKGESREIQYMIKAKDGGTFNLDPATGIYADKDGNILEAKSEPFSVKVITYFEPTPAKTSAPASPEPTTNPVKTASVSLYGEKTDVVLGEDILLKLSAVNLITKPMMHVQVIIIPPSGMSVTSSEFSKIAAGQFTANYELPTGDGRDIEVSIKSNQIGDFNVNGGIIYYFGDEKGTAEDHNLNLPIKVRKEIGSDSVQTQTPAQQSIPGFELFTGLSGLFLLAIILKGKR